MDAAKQHETQQKVYDILGSVETTMLVTESLEGHVEARPMKLAAVEPAGPVWLLTKATPMTEEVARHGEVLLVCQDGTSRFLSLRGRASIVHDPERLRRIWRLPFNLWFPGGVDDPELALMRIEPDAAEFWDATGANRFKYLWESAKLLAGQPTDPSLDDRLHGRSKL